MGGQTETNVHLVYHDDMKMNLVTPDFRRALTMGLAVSVKNEMDQRLNQLGVVPRQDSTASWPRMCSTMESSS